MTLACFRRTAIKPKRNAAYFRRCFSALKQTQHHQPLHKDYVGEPNADIVNLNYYGLATELDNGLHLNTPLDRYHGQGLKFKHVDVLTTSPFLTERSGDRQWHNNYMMEYAPKTDVIGIIGYEPYIGESSYINIVGIEESTGLLCCIKYDHRKLKHIYSDSHADPNVEVSHQTHSELQEFIAQHLNKWRIQDLEIRKLEGGVDPDDPYKIQYRIENSEHSRQLIHGFLTISTENSGNFGLAFETLKPHQTESYSKEVLALNKDYIFQFPFHSASALKDDILVLRPRHTCLVPHVFNDARQWRYKTNVVELVKAGPGVVELVRDEIMSYQEWQGATLVKVDETLEEIKRFIQLSALNNPLYASKSYGTPTDEEWEEIGQWEEYYGYDNK